MAVSGRFASNSNADAMQIQHELAAPNARVQLVRYNFKSPPSSALRPNDHFRIELCLVPRHRSARGCFPAYWRASRFERIGRVFVVPPGNELLARSDETESLTSIVCELKAQQILEMFDVLPEATDRRLLASLDVRDATVQNLLQRLADEAKNPGFASEMLVEAVATQLSIQLFRLGTTLSSAPESGGLSAWQLRLIDERVMEVGAAPTLASLAELCRISVRTLTRGFPKSRGCTVGAYVAKVQIEHAKELLTRGRSVSEIATTLGFSTCSNFSYAFRRAVGVPPKEFRKKALRRDPDRTQ